MTITNRFFFFFFWGVILLVSGIAVFLVMDHVINYRTWGDNDSYFVDDFYGYEVTCDYNYFAEPTNCKAVDDNGIQVSNEILLKIIPKEAECYMIENENILPCRMS